MIGHLQKKVSRSSLSLMRTPEVAPVKYGSLGTELLPEHALEKDLDPGGYSVISKDTGSVKAKSYNC